MPSTVVTFFPNPSAISITNNSTTLYTVSANQFARVVWSADAQGATSTPSIRLDGTTCGSCTSDSTITQIFGYSDWNVPTGTTVQLVTVTSVRNSFVVEEYDE